MTTQRKKLEGNGMWESSRMMLPEHIKRINEYNNDIKAKDKPILYGDELEVIYRKISESYENKTEITLVLFDRFEDTRAIGVVERIDTIGRRVRVDGEWFSITDVIGVE
ncbi:YolD-like family protein [Paenibacillus sp. NPDC057967]|uniref:YolD-like family protein n=1 Tax=Paenibacillus sp. NPDC057967 TaxID=3346293 RepID=UPI0036DEF47B